MAQTLSNVFGAHQAEVQPGARALDDAVIETSASQWAYALVVPVEGNRATGATLITAVEVQVMTGQVGVGLLSRDGTSFVSETHLATGAETAVVLRGEADNVSALVFRNVSGDGASCFRVITVGISAALSRPLPYPVALRPRRYEAESIPVERERVFDDDAADAINTARMNFIRGLNLPLQGRRVLDVGAGVGYFARWYADCGAQVVAVEGRPDNVRLLRERHPDVDAHVGDVQEMSLERLGRFDIVHCFGLLYHLDSPVAALRRLVRVCDGVLLLETIVCDADTPVMVLADETPGVNQALAGLGCRPSPTFVALALNRVGFRFVYGAAMPPAHPDFQFDWRNDLSAARDGHNLRCVFVASRRPIVSEGLYPFIED